MSSEQVVKFARDLFIKGARPQAVADKLAETALRRHSADNIAVVVVDLGGPAGGWAAAKPAPSGGLFGAMFGR